MQTWQKAYAKHSLTGIGNPDRLGLPKTAFFASRQCPGTAIRAAMDWALQQAKLKAVVVSGFHSPLEQSVLKVLIQARSPVVAVLAACRKRQVKAKLGCVFGSGFDGSSEC